MEWLTQNWLLILVVGAFAWMMLGRRAGGGGCCGGGASEPEARKPAEDTIPPRPLDRAR